MKTLQKAIVALVTLTTLCSAGAQARITEIPMLSGDEVSIKRAKLDQIAVVVSMLSDGKSQLRKDLGVGASPNGRAFRPVDLNTPKPIENAWPFLVVFPVSEPVKTKLEGIGKGRVLGAVSALAPIGALESKTKAEPGVYMLFMREPVYGGITTKYQSLLLVSLSVDDKGCVNYKEVAHTDDEYTEVVVDHRLRVGEYPQISISYDSKIPWRANVEMQWLMEIHKFSFDMEIMLL